MEGSFALRKKGFRSNSDVWRNLANFSIRNTFTQFATAGMLSHRWEEAARDAEHSGLRAELLAAWNPRQQKHPRFDAMSRCAGTHTCAGTATKKTWRSKRMAKHIHVSQHEQQGQIREGIALQGFALQHVLASAEEPAFSYTVGLAAPGTARPELVISGLHTVTRVAWLLDIGFRMQGPPPPETRQRLARLQGRVPVFPAGGERFVPGKRYRDLADQGLPTCFAEVARAYYETHLGQAIAFHGGTAFPVLQVIWPDPHGFFPWEPSFDQHWQPRQRLLCHLPTLLSQWRKNEGEGVTHKREREES